MREFIDADDLTRSERDRFENLVILCHACHGKWESLPLNWKENATLPDRRNPVHGRHLAL